MPAALLRSRRIRISGSGAGSASIAEIMAELAVYMGHIAAGAVDVPVRVFALPDIARAWAAEGAGGDRVAVTP